MRATAKLTLIAFILVILVILILDLGWHGTVDLNTAILLITAIAPSFALFFLAMQTLHQVRVAEAEFIHGLARDVDNNVSAELALSEGGELYNPVENLTATQKAMLIPLLTFFERLSYSIYEKVGSLGVYDDLFGYRFFLAMHNPNVQRHLLLADGMKDSWCLLFRLHKSWVALRRRNRRPIPRADHLSNLETHAFYTAG